MIASHTVLTDNKSTGLTPSLIMKNMLHSIRLLASVLAIFPAYLLSAQDTVYTWSSGRNHTYGDAPPTNVYGYKDTQSKELSTPASIEKDQEQPPTLTLTAGELANQTACRRESTHLKKAQSLQDKASHDALVDLYQKAKTHFCR